MAMTKAEIIANVMNDSSSSRFALGSSSDDGAGSSEEMVATLQASLEKLPTDATVRVCADFSDLRVECCETCHHFHPHYEMALIDIESGGNAWICCALDQALNPIKLANMKSLPEYKEIERLFGFDVEN